MASAEHKLKNELGADQWFLTDNGRGGFGVRFSDGAFGIVPAGDRLYVMPISHVKHIEIHRTWGNASRTTGGLSVTGALVGGMLLGPAGMLLGGTTGKRTTRGKDYLTNLWIQIDVWGPQGGGALNFFVLKNGGSMFSDTLLMRSEQLAAHAHALVSQVIRLGAQPAPAEQIPHHAQPALPAPEPAAEFISFESRVESALERLGWRLRRHDDTCLVGLRGERRGVFVHDPLGGSPAGVEAAFRKHRQFAEATSGGLVVANLFVEGRRQAEALGYKVFELQALEQKARRAPPRQAAIPKVEGAFNF